MPWNLTTPPTDTERLRRILKLPAERLWLDNILLVSMDRVAKESPETIDTIQSLLTQAEGLRSQRQTMAADSNAGLIRKKVDVLEWEWGNTTSRTDSLYAQEIELIDEIAAALLIDLPDRDNGAYLARS